MDIYTAQYKYSGDDRMDITVKGSQYPGEILAPTWEMVCGIKDQKLSQWDYTVQYFSLIIARLTVAETVYTASINRIALDTILKHEQLTLVCFCPSGEFCHRVLAARMIENMGYGKYLGERVI